MTEILDDLRRWLLSDGFTTAEAEEWVDIADKRVRDNLGLTWMVLATEDIDVLRDLAIWCRERGRTVEEGLAWQHVLGVLRPKWFEPWIAAGYTATQTEELQRACPTNPEVDGRPERARTWIEMWRDGGIPADWTLRYVHAGIGFNEAQNMEAERTNGHDRRRELELLAALRRRHH